MKPVDRQTKTWLLRVALRVLRKLVDLADDRLHAAEVRMRDEIANEISVYVPVEPSRIARTKGATVSCPYPFPSDELLRRGVRGRLSRSGQSQRTAKAARHGMTAAEFDLRFARS